MSLFWKAYYKMTLGDNYKSSIANATELSKHVKLASSGKVSTFYNVDGERIRGWYKSPTKPSLRHPLENYYSNK